MLKLLNALVSHLYLIVALAWTCVTPFAEHFSTNDEKSTLITGIMFFKFLINNLILLNCYFEINF